MRPLDKFKVGDSISLDGKSYTISKTYKPYGKARPFLLANFGDYCSYCENCLHNGTLFDTEHIRPKSIYPGLEYDWSNFLIGCRACNGPGGKHDDDFPIPDMHLPHINNTYLSLVYEEAGVVKVNPTLSTESQTNAQALIDFLKLDKGPVPSLADKDGRCEMRRKTWELAQTALRMYDGSQSSLDWLIMLAKAHGGWSIWFTVFKDFDEVRKALIEEFPGTDSNCFDPSNHYEPINRNPGKSDPT